MYLVRTPSIIKPLARDILWKVDTVEKCLYLTFDDGPTPDVTDLALDLLLKFNAKGTFFCLGQNANLYPTLMDRLRREGHTIGNHSYDHPDGWRTSLISYLRNSLRAAEVFESKYFRPPYGRITRSQSQAISKRFKIVMWHVLSADFDNSISKEKCRENVISNAGPGSIVVFHDSVKAKDRMLYSLEATLEWFSAEGYIFRPL